MHLLDAGNFTFQSKKAAFFWHFYLHFLFVYISVQLFILTIVTLFTSRQSSKFSVTLTKAIMVQLTFISLS